MGSAAPTLYATLSLYLWIQWYRRFRVPYGLRTNQHRPHRASFAPMHGGQAYSASPRWSQNTGN